VSPLRSIRMRLRGQRGFTLIELLLAVTIGMIVVLAAVNLLDASVRGSDRVINRVEGFQKGRIGLELITKRLRSQVCPDKNTPAIAAGTGESVSFYSELGDETFRPEGRMITLSGGAITERVWNTLANPFANTFAQPSSRTRRLVDDVATSPGVPLFRYYAFEGNNPARPELLLQAPLSATDRARVVKMTVAFESRPGKRVNKADNSDTAFENDVYVRTADPTDPDHSPACD
jgi:prepilin-type N-terminal cleavage/methylation domain-containing protein